MNKMRTLFFSLSVLAGVSQLGLAVDPATNPAKANWLKLSSPGEGHRALNDMVGKWNFTLKWWATPEGKSEESKGTSTNKWILGGRYLQQEAKAQMVGQTFQGLGLMGYDNVREEYQSVWMDSMGTGLMTSTGSRDAEKNILKETGTFADAATGEKSKWFRSETKIVNKNEHVYEMYLKNADGQEFKSMEITYRRAK